MASSLTRLGKQPMPTSPRLSPRLSPRPSPVASPSLLPMDATLPAINSTPSCLNLLALEPSGASYGRPWTSGAHPVLRKAFTEFAIALHTVMLVFALVHAHESWVAAVVLLVLVPFHPMVLHFVMHWWRWRRDVALACHGAALQEKHIECSACSKRVQRGQAVFLAFDLTFCSARCRSICIRASQRDVSGLHERPAVFNTAF